MQMAFCEAKMYQIRFRILFLAQDPAGRACRA